MRRKVVTVLFVVAMVICFGCKQGSSSGGSGCPSTSDNATWSSYGGFVFDQEGPDSAARGIVTGCGWHVEGGHNGGVGDTLQIVSSDESVIFTWAFNRFLAYTVSSGWSGRTHGGVGIGDDVQALLNAHAGFSRISSTLYRLDNGNDRVEARFDSNDRLVELVVGRYYRR